MNGLPARQADFALPSRALARAAKAGQRMELALHRYGLDARFQAECDRIDSQAIADVTRGALEEEMNVLDWGLERAGQSLAKRELVARMVAQQSSIDRDRIARRFGR